MSRPFDWEDYTLEPVPHFLRVWDIIEGALSDPRSGADVQDYCVRLSRTVVDETKPIGGWNPSGELPRVVGSKP